MRFKVPQYAKEEAQRALRIRASLPESEKFGLSHDDARKLGIDSGVDRARQLISQKYIGEDTAHKIARFEQRFKNCHTPKCEGSLGLWGGRKYGEVLAKRFGK